MRSLFILSALLVAACDYRVYRATGEQVTSRNSTPPSDPAYVVARPLFEQSAPAATSTASVNGETFYFSSAKLLDLANFDFRNPITQQNQGYPERTVIALKLTPEGSHILGAWSERNIGKRLGIFLDGKLIQAPEIKSRIEAVVPIGTDFSREEAASVVARLRRGGAA